MMKTSDAIQLAADMKLQLLDLFEGQKVEAQTRAELDRAKVALADVQCDLVAHNREPICWLVNGDAY